MDESKSGTQNYKGAMDCFRQIMRQEGIKVKRIDIYMEYNKLSRAFTEEWSLRYCAKFQRIQVRVCYRFILIKALLAQFATYEIFKVLLSKFLDKKFEIAINLLSGKYPITS